MRVSAAALAFLLAGASTAQEAENNGSVPHHPSAEVTDRVIVKWVTKSPVGNADTPPRASADRIRRVGNALGRNLKPMRTLGRDLEVLQFDAALDADSFNEALTKIRADAEIEYAQPDRRRYAHAVPNDPLYTTQWYLQGAQPSAIRANDAWETSTGAANVVIAILDTGIRFDHPDLRPEAQGGRLLPGYDFVSADPKTGNTFKIANDGNGRDPDASDPGDWVSAQDAQHSPFNADCIPPGQDHADSSWHGTRVAGIVGARTNNGEGVAGIAWKPLLLPVRVLGKCGGYDSDIIAAMRWAAGLPIQDVPDNKNPARIVNLSLGSDTACGVYQTVVNELAARGVLVVASAGNDTGHAVSAPANCAGVLGVAGLRNAGTKVGYSNVGLEIGIGAPGGNCGDGYRAGDPCRYSIDTTTNSGATAPASNTYTDQLNFNVGTSFSAPIVAGAAALMRSANTQLTPAQTIIRLKQTAAPFPAPAGVPLCQAPTSADQLECSCTTGTCGAGMLNADAAVAAALRPFVIVTASPTSPTEGQTVTLNGAASFAADNRTITTYLWSVVATGAETPIITGANLPGASFTAPAAGSVTVRLAITDSAGAQDFADVVVITPLTQPAPTPPSSSPSSAPASSGGGGGGVFGLELLAIALFALRRRLARR